ncbi:MAG: DNA repair protein RecN [Acidobacteria bacterium]|nr:MAG: DNA repair protein RecN [Acidobacteriota bacterium]
MLITLQIENYALMERVSIRFGPGLNVLTGETGSGKSILVDALGLLLGERAEAGTIRSGASLATVTGSFDSPFASTAEAAAWCEEHGLTELEAEIRLRREVGATRSRAFIDHQLATVGLLRELAQRLGEVHSQNEALVSFTPAAQLRLLDRFAGTELEVSAVGEAYARWREANERLRNEEVERRRQEQEADLWRFQLAEIDGVAPVAGEDARLSEERQILANAERVLGAAQVAYGCLYDEPEAAAAQLKAAQKQIQDWQRFDPAVASLSERIEAVRVEVDDIAQESRRLAERVEASPSRLATVEERLAALDRLQRKYGPSLGEVLSKREEVAEKLDRFAHAGEIAAQTRAQAAATEAEYRRLADALSRKRQAAAKQLQTKLEAEVAELAMTLRFEVEFAEVEEWSAAGWDRIRFLASTNPGEPLQPVAAIASGGELSRLLLALHLVAEARQETRTGAAQRTLVLDEIDAGIGGRAAAAVGQKLQRLGEHYQVLCVTHLAQIACYASTHLRVEKQESKGRTTTAIEPLEGEARTAEIARMLAGNASDPTALKHAHELLASARPRRAAHSSR